MKYYRNRKKLDIFRIYLFQIKVCFILFDIFSKLFKLFIKMYLTLD